MENNIQLIESLLEKAGEYGKTSFDLVKLQTVDKVTDGISSAIPHSFVIIALGTVLFFANVGAALWLGEWLDEISYGFFIVAGFYVLVAFILYFFLRKSIKRSLYDYMIKQLLK